MSPDKLKTNREIVAFLLVGGAAVLVDYAAYTSLILALDSVDLAKVLGFIAGSLISFIANRKFTFESKDKIRYRTVMVFALLYLCTLSINAAVNNLAILISGNYEIAFLLATFISASINFFGLKLLVFNK